jgi:hypothetical protein
MKQVVAAAALFCLPSTVVAHDIYRGFRDQNGHLCCNDKDCKPVHATPLPDGSYYLPASDETIPALPTPSYGPNRTAHSRGTGAMAILTRIGGSEGLPIASRAVVP